MCLMWAVYDITGDIAVHAVVGLDMLHSDFQVRVLEQLRSYAVVGEHACNDTYRCFGDGHVENICETRYNAVLNCILLILS